MFERKFEWVDQEDPASIRSARKHCAREGQRAKRVKSVQKYQRQQANPQNLQSDKAESESNRNVDDDSSQATKRVPPKFSKEDSGYDSDSTTSTEHERRITVQSHSSQYPTPLNALACWQRDQFGRLPVKLDVRGDFLVNHFVAVMPPLLQNVKESASNKMILNPLSQLGPISFRSIVLVAASMHVAKLQGHKYTVESLQHKSKAIRLISSRLDHNSSAGGATNEMISAVLGLAYDENQFGTEEMTLVHMKAAMRMVRLRGGQDAIDELPILSMFVNWVNTDMVSPLKFSELPALSTVSRPHDPHGYIFGAIPDPLSKYTDLDSFLEFLSNAEQLYHLHRKMDPGINPIRRKIFRPHNTFHQLLTRNIAYKGWDSDRNGRVARNLQMLTLILLTNVLWIYRGSAQACDRFLKALHLMAIEANLDISLATGILDGMMWKMEYDGDEFACEERIVTEEKRIWHSGRMLRVSRVLSQKSFDKVHFALLSFLQMDDGAVESVAANNGSDWRTDIRKEILSQEEESQPRSSISQ